MRCKSVFLGAAIMASATLLFVATPGMAQRNGGGHSGSGGYGHGGYGGGYGHGYGGGYGHGYGGGYGYYPGYSNYYWPRSYNYGWRPNSYYSGHDQGGYQSNYYGADTAGMGDEEQEGATLARINVRVPADAKVWFEGKETRQQGSTRSFTSPALEPGQEYSYQVKAEWNENGQPVTKSRKVKFHAGDMVNVDMRGDAVRAGTPERFQKAEEEADPGRDRTNRNLDDNGTRRSGSDLDRDNSRTQPRNEADRPKVNPPAKSTENPLRPKDLVQPEPKP
jgi:uncharacterized protein (TIGR03000 family)